MNRDAPILNLDEAATYTRLSKTTLMRAARRGDLRGSKAGGRWTFRHEDLDAWWEAGRPSPRRRDTDPMPRPRSDRRGRVAEIERMHRRSQGAQSKPPGTAG